MTEQPETDATPADTSPAWLRAQAAKIIAHAITTGDLRHPDRAEAVLFLAGLQPASHPDEKVREALTATANLISEAIVYTALAGLDAELITRADLETLTTTATNTPSQLVTLQCDHGELLRVRVIPGTDTAKIACDRLRTGLAECETP